MKRDNFTFYRSYYEALKNLPQREQTKVVMAICAYALDETLPELTGVALSVFTLIRPTLDTGRIKAENRKNKTKTKQEQKRNEKEGEKEGEKEKERENDSSPPLPPSKPDWGFGPELTSALSDWLRYKREKRQPYKPTGESNLVSQVRSKALSYGEAAVAALIRQSMSSNYQGIVWDWLEKQPPPAKGTNNWQRVPYGSSGQGELGELERRAVERMRKKAEEEGWGDE